MSERTERAPRGPKGMAPLPPVYVRRTASAFISGDRVGFARAYCTSLSGTEAEAQKVWERRGTVVEGEATPRSVPVVWDDAPDEPRMVFTQHLIRVDD